MDKPTQPKPSQSSKYVYVPGNQASATTSSTFSGLEGASHHQHNHHQLQGEDWKDDGGGDSGLEDGAQTDFVHQEEQGTSLSLTTFSQEPVLKVVKPGAKQTTAGKSRLVTKAVMDKRKPIGQSETTGRGKGQQQVKKSIWDRLGNKAGVAAKGKGKVRYCVQLLYRSL